MTTEPRPVVPGMEELRDRIAQTVLDVTEIEHEYDDFGPVDHIANKVDIADAILETIAAAGLSIVATDRLERIEAFASAAATVERHVEDVFSRDVVLPHHVEELNRRTSHVHTLRREAFAGLQPGDVEMIPLEPLAGGNER